MPGVSLILSTNCFTQCEKCVSKGLEVHCEDPAGVGGVLKHLQLVFNCFIYFIWALIYKQYWISSFYYLICLDKLQTLLDICFTLYITSFAHVQFWTRYCGHTLSCLGAHYVEKEHSTYTSYIAIVNTVISSWVFSAISWLVKDSNKAC